MAEGDAAPPLTARAAREVQFREKLRGYHPDDVDQFVEAAAAALEGAEERIAALETQLAQVEAREVEPSESEDALRRTLVLAQRTADLAMQEAREDAARLLAEARAEFDALTSESAALRARLHEEAEAEVAPIRDRLLAERAALQADVDAIDRYLGQERERLRIYFTDQLQRVEDGYPGLTPPPEMQAAARPAPTPEADDPAGTADASAPPADAPQRDRGDGIDDDAFLAELRRAVADEAPLGPRDDDAAPDAADADDFDMFAPDEEDGGRFGGLRRRRR